MLCDCSYVTIAETVDTTISQASDSMQIATLVHGGHRMQVVIHGQRACQLYLPQYPTWRL